MTKSGFDDDVPPNWFSASTTVEPYSSRSGVGILGEVEILPKKKFSYSLIGGPVDAGKVEGYDAIGRGNHISLLYYNWLIHPAVNLHYSNHKFTIGPALDLFAYKETEAQEGPKLHETKAVMGISISNSFFLFTHENFKAGLMVAANIFTDVTTPQITVSNTLGGIVSPPATYRSVLQPSKINPSTIQLGLCFQF